MIIVNGYTDIEKLVPTVYDIPKIASQAPFIFYCGGTGDHDYVCWKKGNEIMYPTNYLRIIDTLRQKESKILELDTKNDTVMIDFSKDNPEVIYNNETNQISGRVTNFPPKYLETCSQVYIFNRYGKPIKVSITRAIAAFIISESLLFLQRNTEQQFMDLQARKLFVTYLDKSGFSLVPHVIDEVATNLFPVSRFDLDAKQCTEFTRAIGRSVTHSRKSKKLNLPKENKAIIVPTVYKFSDILSNVPDVKSNTDVELDLDLADLGIRSVVVAPNKQLIITIKLAEGRIFDRDEYIDVLGHQNFTLCFVV
jgi:hypothetical protein